MDDLEQRIERLVRAHTADVDWDITGADLRHAATARRPSAGTWVATATLCAVLAAVLTLATHPESAPVQPGHRPASSFVPTDLVPPEHPEIACPGDADTILLPGRPPVSRDAGRSRPVDVPNDAFPTCVYWSPSNRKTTVGRAAVTASEP